MKIIDILFTIIKAPFAICLGISVGIVLGLCEVGTCRYY